MPWKNGGGVTHEALRLPAGDGPFRCRVSVARIDASGPFSDFRGYDRKMVLLQGDGIELRFGEFGRRTLTSVGEMAEFDGAIATQGILLGGPCIDLNLMVAKPDPAEARVERVVDTHVRAGAEQMLLVFPIDRRVSLDLDGAEGAVLEPWDLAVLTRGGARLRAREPAGAAAESGGVDAAGAAVEAARGYIHPTAAVFLATLNLMS